MTGGALGPILDAVASNLSGVGTLVALIFGFRWLRRGAAIGYYLQIGGYFLAFLALLLVLGVVDGIDVAPLADLAGALGRLLGDLAGAVLVAGGGP